jgi:hypothetical protein
VKPIDRVAASPIMGWKATPNLPEGLAGPGSVVKANDGTLLIHAVAPGHSPYVGNPTFMWKAVSTKRDISDPEFLSWRVGAENGRWT